MKKTKISLLVLCLATTCIISSPVYAYSVSEDNTGQNSKPNIILDNKNLNVPSDIILDIIKENPDAGNIIIYDYYDSANESNTNITPSSLWRIKDLKKTVKQSNVVGKDSFVISVAKGQTSTLSSTWSASLSASATGELNVAKLNLTAKVEKTYSSSYKFNGPPESSTYNSREYRVKFYQNKGTYTAVYSSGIPGSGGAWHPVSGNYTEPTKYAAYSIDKKIS